MTNTQTTAVQRRPDKGKVLAEFGRILDTIPDTGDEGMERVYADILAATSPEQLNQSMESSGTDEVLGRTITVVDLAKGRSDHTDGLGFFLVVSYTEPGGDEVGTFTIGAATPVLTLLKCWGSKWLPVDVVITRSERKTKAGHYPLNIKIMGLSFDAPSQEA